MKHVALLFSLVVLATGSVVPASAQSLELETVLSRAGEYVEQYYTRTQSLLVEETVILQPLSRSWSFEGFARRLEYELRVEWDPSLTEEPARVVRELVRASGPPLGPPDQEDCMDPRAISPEPLAFLLPDRRDAFSFEVAGSTRVDGREAVMLDYRVVARGQPTAEWTGKCAWVDLSGRTRGRVWADANTFEILRFDEHLVGLVDIPRPRDRSAYGPRFFTFERADSSIRYQRVTFENPDETLMLPARIESTTIFGTPVFRGCAPHRPTPTTAGSSPMRGSSRSLISCLHPSWPAYASTCSANPLTEVCLSGLDKSSGP